MQAVCGRGSTSLDSSGRSVCPDHQGLIEPISSILLSRTIDWKRVRASQEESPFDQASLSLPPSRQAECSRYFGGDLLRPVTYVGPVKTRRRLAQRLGIGLTFAANGNGAGDNGEDDGDGCGGGEDGSGNIDISSNGEAARGGSRGDAVAAAAAAVEEGEGEGEQPERANVVITSYNVLRTDARVLGDQVIPPPRVDEDAVGLEEGCTLTSNLTTADRTYWTIDPTQGWLYLVLDEAHLLRNPSTRTAKAARELRASHRVGLTGTPIQNSVLELWSLFEFLMPG